MYKNHFTAYVIDYYDEDDCRHMNHASDLLYLLTLVKSSTHPWFISECEFIKNHFSRDRTAVIPHKLVARSATYQGV